MKVERQEILPGVMLSYLNTGKFKTSYLSVSFINQLERETASLNALIPNVLLRGSAAYPDMEKLTARMEELYGAAVVPVVRRIGEIQTVGLAVSFPEEAFLPKGSDEFGQVAGLLSEIMFRPAFSGKSFRKDYVESEKEKLVQLLESVINDKRTYAYKRCVEEMCCYEDYSVGRCGRPEDVENVTAGKLTRRYRELLETSPVEIFYCGREASDRVADVIIKEFSSLPRGEINYDIGTDIRYNSVEEQPRSVTEEMDVSQSRLVMGFRLGDSMDLELKTPISVFNAVFGGSSNSKLFLNIREKMQLCYDVFSTVDLRKGLLFILCGTDSASVETAKNGILQQLEAISRGEITDEELETAKAIVESDVLSTEDSQQALESYYIVRALEGSERTPEESAEAVRRVSREDVAAVANAVCFDITYLLLGNSDSSEEVQDD